MSQKQPETSKIGSNRKPPNAGNGRPKGAKNRNTAEIKDMIRQALEEVGGVNYLMTQAADNPTAFLTLVGKIVPREINADVKVEQMTPEQVEARLAALLEKAGIG